LRKKIFPAENDDIFGTNGYPRISFVLCWDHNFQKAVDSSIRFTRARIKKPVVTWDLVKFIMTNYLKMNLLYNLFLLKNTFL
jgi:hypothetical protein